MRLPVFILLFAFLLPFGVGTGLWHIRKQHIRKQVKRMIVHGLPKDQLQFFSFQLSEIDKAVNWKHAKEFELNGAFYDIVYRDTIGNIIEFWCYIDQEETEVHEQILDLARQQHQSDSQQGNFWKQLLEQFNAYSELNSSVLVSIFPEYSIGSEWTNTIKHLFSQHIQSVPSPPPSLSEC